MANTEVLMYIHLLFNRLVYKLSRPSDWMAPVYRVHDPNAPPRPSVPVACTLPHGVMLGSSFDACSSDLFESMDIRAVVNVTPDIPCFFRDKSVAYVRMSIDDNERSRFCTDMLQSASDFITEQVRLGGQVLVHCVMGRSRSVCVCCYHFMKQHGMSFAEIYGLISVRRPQVRVNQNFVHDLAREFPRDGSLQKFMSSSMVTCD